ncbi:RNA splicing factor [Komagataella phaffii CBS 7435]|uniref:Pre-mRNA-splicing factor SLU7 n=2 Tax=Komagataella phaffii TaxID=460519 RepID=C4QVV2_KOMPG|nr:Hypothetical protein PAS_chr1-1_0021 [Komagataella phaffii GS115]AOA60585.1 GQ67_02578T0 [Komagataella phaffii]CAH2446034.1 RNA splicing factor [Komagataella phaffii CBS 7435]AOA65593.1 GQ68_02670T0 [Komagataella phaffii GS115]CAY67375.1 Hypothetical protein PAS_chr1-1_0021 [Komagataella phaffii GS115]CCA36475.1 RNA splicing factor [Komagataella phaffii CBS 7435]
MSKQPDNTYVPKFIKDTPWYAGEHQREETTEKNIKDRFIKHKGVGKECKNCGMPHNEKDCFEKPKRRKVNKQSDTIMVRDTDDWDSKRDKWFGYNADEEYQEQLAKWNANEAKKQRAKLLKDLSAQVDLLYSWMIQGGEVNLTEAEQVELEKEILDEYCGEGVKRCLQDTGDLANEGFVGESKVNEFEGSKVFAWGREKGSDTTVAMKGPGGSHGSDGQTKNQDKSAIEEKRRKLLEKYK